MSIVIPVPMTDRPCQHGAQLPDYVCPRCGVRGPGDAVVTWVVRSMCGFPMRAMNIVTRYRCWSCHWVVDCRGGNFGAPPLLHRNGWLCFLVGSLSIVFLVAWSTFPHSSSGLPSQRERAMVARIAATAQESGAEFATRSAACLARWRDVVATRFPRGLLDKQVAELALPAGVDWWSQPVLPVREQAADLARLYAADDGVRPLPCDLRLSDQDRSPILIDFSYSDVPSAQRRLEELQERLRQPIEPTQLGVVDWACAGRTCKIAMAIIDGDGKLLALKRHEERWKDKTMGAADLRWGLHQRWKGLPEVRRFGN